MAKKIQNLSESIEKMTFKAPQPMEYYVSIENDKDRVKYISRIEKIIRNSMEYRDYITYLKENCDLNRCAFFQNVTSEKRTKRNKVSIELHHEPFTLFDYVNVVVNKYIQEGYRLNDLLIADEVLELHYENKVGLVPLSKTVHQVIHNSDKLIVPLNMCYGEYSQFLSEYDQYVPDELYDKLSKKIDQTNNLTPESFNALKKQFLYLDVEGFEEAKEVEVAGSCVA